MNKKILIIENDDCIRNTLQVCLECEHYSVITVATPQDGMGILETQMINLVVIDINLSGDGINFINQLEQHPKYKNTPVIPITASDWLIPGKKVIYKPFIMQTLLAEIVEQFGRKNLMGEKIWIKN